MVSPRLPSPPVLCSLSTYRPSSEFSSAFPSQWSGRFREQVEEQFDRSGKFSHRRVAFLASWQDV